LGAEDPFVGLDVFGRGSLMAFCETEFVFGFTCIVVIGGTTRGGYRVRRIGGFGISGIRGVCLGGRHFGFLVMMLIFEFNLSFGKNFFFGNIRLE
jgi:hypothetical protein